MFQMIFKTLEQKNKIVSICFQNLQPTMKICFYFFVVSKYRGEIKRLYDPLLQRNHLFCLKFVRNNYFKIITSGIDNRINIKTLLLKMTYAHAYLKTRSCTFPFPIASSKFRLFLFHSEQLFLFF